MAETTELEKALQAMIDDMLIKPEPHFIDALIEAAREEGRAEERERLAPLRIAATNTVDWFATQAFLPDVAHELLAVLEARRDHE